MYPGRLERSSDFIVTSMYRACQALLPAMLANGNGSIINMSSVVSILEGAPNRFAYGTTKAAVIGLTKAIGADYVARGTRCSAICPATTGTPSLSERMTAQDNLARFGTSVEISGLALYLTSDESGFTTGQAHVIDGGWSF